MLVQRCRWWPNIEPALDQCLLLAYANALWKVINNNANISFYAHIPVELMQVGRYYFIHCGRTRKHSMVSVHRSGVRRNVNFMVQWSMATQQLVRYASLNHNIYIAEDRCNVYSAYAYHNDPPTLIWRITKQ